ncbi:MAG: tRNA pseudouridine(38-40) synthase TruA [Eubacteriales bacterium]|nr:tRNA pseudouridine(38-40) synthase TruA [Eubacteriales bacterium]
MGSNFVVKQVELAGKAVAPLGEEQVAGDLRHYALLLSYEGAAFHGWQDQDNALTVQAVLRSAWRDLSGEDLHFQGSSRTDAGVSARGHVSNFASRSPIPSDRLARVLNGYLPATVRVREVRPVSPDFHARYQAGGKLYVYRLFNQPYASALLGRLTCHAPQKLNLEAMQEAADYLCGEHDFTAFMDQGSVVRKTKRRLDRLEVIPDPLLPVLNLVCLGPAFLYHQVRILAGSLYYVGQGKLKLATVKRALADKDRKLLGKTMPPQGLCLERVFYPQAVFGQDSLEDYAYLRQASRQELWQQIRLG